MVDMTRGEHSPTVLRRLHILPRGFVRQMPLENWFVAQAGAIRGCGLFADRERQRTSHREWLSLLRPSGAASARVKE